MGSSAYEIILQCLKHSCFKIEERAIMRFPLSCKTGESVISWHIQELFSISVDSEKCFSFLGTKGLFAGFLQNVLWVNLAQWAEGGKMWKSHW